MFVFYFAAKGQRSLIHGVPVGSSFYTSESVLTVRCRKAAWYGVCVFVSYSSKKEVHRSRFVTGTRTFVNYLFEICFLSKLSHCKWSLNHWWQNAKTGFDEYMQTCWILTNWVTTQLPSKELLTDAYFITRYDRETSIYLLVTYYQAHLITANFCWMLYSSSILWNALRFFLRYGAVLREDCSLLIPSYVRTFGSS